MTIVIRPQDERARVVITGVGAVTPLAHTAIESFAAMLEGRSGAAPITLFDTTGCNTRFACEVKAWDPPSLDTRRRKELDRFSEFAVVAAQEAIKSAGLTLSDEESFRAGCLLGVGMGGIQTIEDTVKKLAGGNGRRVSPFTIPATAPNLAAGQISIEHKLRGPSFSIASACATGCHAIGEAALMIRYGRADVMIAGGAEATITPVAMAGFSSMRALSKNNDDPAHASRPFDTKRDGFVCGEGSGVLVLERLDRAQARGATILAEIIGYGASSDAHHIAAPLEDGDGSRRSMLTALADARINAGDVDHLNAHATSTPLGDTAEARAARGVFGDHVKNVVTTATKSMVGHLLGAAGAVATVATAQALARGLIPATINIDELDADIGLDVVRGSPREMRPKNAVVNAFGFGGTNASLVLAPLR
ncbi:MAG TPA: beta-ketoacyl-ACP synthase II [Myxococcota bacterium]|jgi:3-oxoacyl-[acyl-carrier-protein] synthase II